MAYIIQCDRCSKQGGQVGQDSHAPKEWVSVRLTLRGTGRQHFNWFQFCPDCVEHLGIQDDIAEETSAEKLVAILESMVEEAVSERGE